MILRKLADAITAQNWFTVVLEVLIVVVGIFIGLQIICKSMAMCLCPRT